MFQRFIDCLRAHSVGQPIWRIVFTEIVPLTWIDQRFLDCFEDIDTNLRESETADLSGDLIDKL
jgi:hypothetical protein